MQKILILKTIFIFIFLVFTLNCSTLPEREVSPTDHIPLPKPTSEPPAQNNWIKENVDLSELQKALRMDRSKTELGVQSQTFNTCVVGAGYNPYNPCRNLHLSVLHFRVRCRASMGTVEHVSHTELRPLANNTLRWMLANQSGQVVTDYDGYGQVAIASNYNLKQDRFILRAKTNNLGLRVNQISQIIVPNDWCD